MQGSEEPDQQQPQAAEQSMQSPPHGSQQPANNNIADKDHERSAENRLISLGIVLLAISVAISLLYLFSTNAVVEKITSYF